MDSVAKADRTRLVAPSDSPKTLKTTGLVSRIDRSECAQATRWQRSVRQLRRRGAVPDVLLLTEHPATYTCGRGTRPEHLLADADTYASQGIQLCEVERGGSATYHGPGQLVGYPIVDLRPRRRDVHLYIRNLEQVLIRTLGDYDISAQARSGLTGVWCGGRKVAAIGIHVSQWITMHGFAINVSPDLEHFLGIVPCGLAQEEVTSMAQFMPAPPDVWELLPTVSRHFGEVFELEMERVPWATLQPLLTPVHDNVAPE